ncbi:nucleoside triphosphate pyrophosphohydrolase [Glycocaulis albus]|jgi:MazG family protein|uniref:Nucleoside triphosphate pyrophosphohydrolase n=1 Tax=Glycocaulis albus TaxID=1382801 RepID=A0ABQ1XFZ2_9PROT|nr:nucleoside triphosphate pyrophosphohydrolase [Glycocaulis albus]GGG93387.1 nucleoside triphosphate pyrophosphohydrolase [Glycocaulis albus]
MPDTPLDDQAGTQGVTGNPLDRLLAIMARLRDPQTGCPWDVEQDFASIAPYTIEEAYEVADAIARADMADLKSELGDLLFQVVFHSQMASESGHFTFDDVAEAIAGKMERRHPHVFGDGDMRDAQGQTIAWEAQKAQERAARNPDSSALADIPLALPALLRALKLTKRAARVGFDWPDAARVLDKFEEEARELREAIAAQDTANIKEEVGDLLFVCANLARKLDVDPEEALRAANAKFERRFRAVETRMEAAGNPVGQASLDEMEAEWGEVKKAERAGG